MGLKKRVKSRLGQINKERAVTGGRPMNQRPLSEIEERVANLLHPGNVDGDENVEEAGASFLDDEEVNPPPLTDSEDDEEPPVNEEAIDQCMEEYYLALESAPDNTDYVDLMGIEPQPSTSSQEFGAVYEGVSICFYLCFLCLCWFWNFLQSILIMWFCF